MGTYTNYTPIQYHRRNQFRQKLCKFGFVIHGPPTLTCLKFIKQLLDGQNPSEVVHSASSCTLLDVHVPAVLIKQNVPSWDPESNLVLVDTPGFGNSVEDDVKIIERLYQHLAAL